MEFKDKIKTLRTEKDLTQDDVARILGLEQRATVSHWENGRQIPHNIELIKKLAELFEVSTDYLIGTAEEKKAIYRWDELKDMLPKEYRDMTIEEVQFVREMRKSEIPLDTLKQIVEIVRQQKKQ